MAWLLWGALSVSLLMFIAIFLGLPLFSAKVQTAKVFD
jgi:hypothetical protein